jgi:hypothetical protein
LSYLGSLLFSTRSLMGRHTPRTTLATENSYPTRPAHPLAWRTGTPSNFTCQKTGRARSNGSSRTASNCNRQTAPCQRVRLPASPGRARRGVLIVPCRSGSVNTSKKWKRSTDRANWRRIINLDHSSRRVNCPADPVPPWPPRRPPCEGRQSLSAPDARVNPQSRSRSQCATRQRRERRETPSSAAAGRSI